MKNLVFLFMMTFASVFVMPENVQAQETVSKTFLHPDVEKNIIYQVILKVSGYQVEIWYTSTSATGTPPWTQAKVLYSDDNYIKYQIPYNDWQYELTMDPKNEDAIFIKNLTNNGKKLRYFIKE